MSRLPWGPLAAVVATAVLLVGGATASRASWEASTAIGSSTSVAAATIPSVGTVTAKRTDGTLGFTVAVSWTAVAVEGSRSAGTRWPDTSPRSSAHRPARRARAPATPS
ncbi:hypothetical protein ACFQX8_25520 [Klenkia terrae]|uniref:hypothetical protein n=1 Tax=Klenkia terrae TaxID=1052259 RepID=UPI00360F35F0